MNNLGYNIDFFAAEDKALELLDKGVSMGDIITVKVETKCGSAYGVATGRPRETLITGLVMKELINIDSSQRGYYIAQKPRSDRQMNSVISQLLEIMEQ